MSIFIKTNGQGRLLSWVMSDVAEDDYILLQHAESPPSGSVDDWYFDGENLHYSPQPSAAHDWDSEKNEWVFNDSKQTKLDAAQATAKRIEWQSELDTRMEAAVSVAQPLDYASKRKKLPADKAARLAAFNTYIDQLAALEYSETVEWPVQPE